MPRTSRPSLPWGTCGALLLGALLLAAWFFATVRPMFDLQVRWNGGRLYTHTLRDAPVTITHLVAAGPPEISAALSPPIRFPQGLGELPPVGKLDWRDRSGNPTGPPKIGSRMTPQYAWD